MVQGHENSAEWRLLVSSFVVLLAWLFIIGPAESAQTISFAELGNLSLFPDQDKAAGQAPIRLLRNRLQLSSAILKTSEWVQSGRRLDFAIIIGVGLEGYDKRSANEVVQEIKTIFESLPVDYIILLSGPEDCGPPERWDLNRFSRFVQRVKASIPNKTVIDGTGRAVITVRGFRIIAMDTGIPFGSGRTNAATLGSMELERAIPMISAKGEPALLFTYFFDLADELGAGSKWYQTIPPKDRQDLADAITNSWVCGIFGSPIGLGASSRVGVPQIWYSAEKETSSRKAWMMPSVTGDSVAGCQIVTVSDDGFVTATPLLLSEKSADQPRGDPFVKIREGDANREVQYYDDAIKAYKEALVSTNEFVATEAQRMLRLALREKRDEADGPAWTVLKWLQRNLIDILLGLALVWAIWNLIYRVRWLRRGKPYPAKWEINIVCEDALKAASGAFLAEFRRGLKEFGTLAQLFSSPNNRGGKPLSKLGKPLSEGWTLVAPSLPITDAVSEGAVSIGGVDIFKAAGAFEKILARFSWKMEIRLVQCGNTTYAYATRWWGPKSLNKEMWHVESTANSATRSAMQAGRLLAAEISSEGWVKS